MTLSTLALLGGLALAHSTMHPAKHNPDLVESKTSHRPRSAPANDATIRDDFHQRLLRTARVAKLLAHGVGAPGRPVSIRLRPGATAPRRLAYGCTGPGGVTATVTPPPLTPPLHQPSPCKDSVILYTFQADGHITLTPESPAARIVWEMFESRG
ncbi:hypothetical protein [Actinacidiphila alni]|uniref:hypothetical protein n=1 Tax=Actinacidiphila alni TaxID=380248 RepID=UPI003452F2B7